MDGVSKNLGICHGLKYNYLSELIAEVIVSKNETEVEVETEKKIAAVGLRIGLCLGIFGLTSLVLWSFLMIPSPFGGFVAVIEIIIIALALMALSTQVLYGPSR